MPTADSVKTKLQGLIATANEATGGNDTTLAAAVNTLVGGYGQGGGGLAYDMGEFVLDTDVRSTTTDGGIPHGLGAKPDFIVVWTDAYSDLTAENSASQKVNIGYIWLNKLGGKLSQRLTSALAYEDGVLINMTVAEGDYRLSVIAPTSLSYSMSMGEGSFPSAEKIGLHPLQNNAYYRAGITYKYFVSRAWWNIEEGA